MGEQRSLLLYRHRKAPAEKAGQRKDNEVYVMWRRSDLVCSGVVVLDVNFPVKLTLPVQRMGRTCWILCCGFLEMICLQFEIENKSLEGGDWRTRLIHQQPSVLYTIPQPKRFSRL